MLRRIGVIDSDTAKFELSGESRITLNVIFIVKYSCFNLKFHQFKNNEF